MSGEDTSSVSVRTVPVSDVRAGERVVCGSAGVRVLMPPKQRADESARRAKLQARIDIDIARATLAAHGVL